MVIVIGGWSRKQVGGGGTQGKQKKQMDAIWRAAVAAIGAATVSAVSMVLLELSSGDILA